MLQSQSPPVSALLSQALQAHQQGELPAAESLYLAILAHSPNHADALHLLGVLHGQQNRIPSGLKLIQQAIAGNPRVSAYHNNLGNLLLKNADPSAAEKSYRRALRLDERNADAHLNLGKLLLINGSAVQARRCLKAAERLAPQSVQAHMAVGRLEESAPNLPAALESYRRAARLAPAFPAAALALSNVLLALGKDREAEQQCRHALQLDPAYADAHYNLGNLLRATGRPTEAVEHYRQALDLAPGSGTDLSLNLARTLADLGQDHAALEVLLQAAHHAPDSFDTWLALGRQAALTHDAHSAELWLSRAIALQPNRAEPHIELGNLRLASGCAEQALTCYQAAIVLAPENSIAYNNLGGALSSLDLHQQAIDAYRKAMALHPGYQDAIFNLGKELSLGVDEEEGLERLRQVIALNANHASAHLQVGVVMQNRGRLAEATEWYRGSLERDATSLIARSNLGAALAQLGDPEGLALLEQVVQQQPHDPEPHWVWGEKLLLHGHLQQGWREYEWRMQVPKFLSQHRTFTQPRWQGEPLHGRTILLYAEQGQGDTLQFSRYATLVAQLGGRVVLEVQASLQRLLAGLPGVAECVAAGRTVPNFDLYAPLMSLPCLLATRAETIPPPVSPTLVAPAQSLPHPAGRLRVGIAWAGNARDFRDRLRSTRLADWAGLARIEDIDFVSLQTGEAASQGTASHGQQQPNPFHFVADCSRVRDFADTADIIASLDLVISVDTAVAHLAGTLGKPVWILLYNMFDWRWGLQGSQTPWYPTATLFRQTAPADWQPVFADVERALRQMKPPPQPLPHPPPTPRPGALP